MDERDQYVIWSGQWAAWWRPDAAGYTKELLAAGLYTKADADMRVRGLGPEKRVEVLSWAEAWQRWWSDGPGPGSVGAALGWGKSPPSLKRDEDPEVDRLRRRVAHLEHNKRVAVAVFSRNKDGAYLHMRCHDDADRCAGLWMVPGGVVERGETIEEAARREVREEIGCELGEVNVRQTLLDVSSELVLVNVRADLVPDAVPMTMEPDKHGPPMWLGPKAIEKLRGDGLLPGSALAYFFGVGVNQ